MARHRFVAVNFNILSSQQERFDNELLYWNWMKRENSYENRSWSMNVEISWDDEKRFIKK